LLVLLLLLLLPPPPQPTTTTTTTTTTTVFVRAMEHHATDCSVTPHWTERNYTSHRQNSDTKAPLFVGESYRRRCDGSSGYVVKATDPRT